MRPDEQKVKDVCKKVIELDTPDSFGWATEDARRFFTNVFRFYRTLGDADLSIVPNQRLADLFNTTNNFHNTLMQHRNPSYADPDQRFREIQDRWQQAYSHAASEVMLILLMKGEVDTMLHSVRIDGAALHAQAGGLIEKVKESLAEIAGTLAVAKQASAEAATASHAREFEEEAVASDAAAKRWLGFSIGSGIVAIIVTWLLFGSNTILSLPAPAGEKITIHDLQNIVSRIVMVTILYFFVILCGRNYASCRHNYTVNRHRRNAMQTFKAFAAASSDPATKEFMLRQAAACAFTPQQSGYLKDEALPEPPPLLVDATKIAGGKD
jgi:hypothetical protein